MYASVDRAEQDPFTVDSGWRIDAAAGRISPEFFSVLAIEGMERVRVFRDDKDHVAGDHRLGQSAAEFDRPARHEFDGHFGVHAAGATAVVPVGRPGRSGEW